MNKSISHAGEGHFGQHVADYGSVGAVFFALTGTLMATSLVNVGKSGVPFFDLVFLLPLLSLAHPGRRLADGRVSSTPRMVILVWAVAFALLATTFVQIIAFKEVEPGSKLTHLVSRLSFLFYFVVAQRYLQGPIAWRVMVWLRRLLIVVCAYGAYQVPAKLLGFPLFLDWLRNNRSFLMYDYDTAGWIEQVRASSIYAEPAQATIPILVLFILNLRIKGSRLSSIFGWMVLLLFTIATFSRAAWLALFAGTGVLLMLRWARLSHLIARRRWVIVTATLVLLLALPVWGFVGAVGSEDLSAQERPASIVLGLNMIKDSPVLGFGWNSFSDLAPRYAKVPLDTDQVTDFVFIHNMVVSYVQQAGLAGLALAALPFVLLARWSTAPPWMTYFTLVSFLVAAELGGDIGYWSLTWLWLALMVNMRFAVPESVGPASGQRSYRSHMSLPQPSPS